MPPVLRYQVIGVSVVGAVAVVTFLLSFVVDAATGETLRVVAAIAAGICAIIGVSFALTRGSR